jgi:hypothetical protein
VRETRQRPGVRGQQEAQSRLSAHWDGQPQRRDGQATAGDREGWGWGMIQSDNDSGEGCGLWVVAG